MIFSVIECPYHVIDFYHTLLNLFNLNTSLVAKNTLLDCKKDYYEFNYIR